MKVGINFEAENIKLIKEINNYYNKSCQTLQINNFRICLWTN